MAGGGTDRGHRVAIARGPSPSCPWEADPADPAGTAVGTEHGVQDLGHADLVATPDGGTALVLLGVLPLGFANAVSPLGRETRLDPVTWVHGRPSAAVPEPTGTPDEGGRRLGLDRRPPDALLGPQRGQIGAHRRGHDALGPAAGLPRPSAAAPGLHRRRGGGRLRGRGGVAARHDEQHRSGLEAAADGDRTVVTARAVLAGLEHSWTAPFPAGPVRPRIEQQLPPDGFVPAAIGGGVVQLPAAWADADPVLLAAFDGRSWSYEVATSSTGRVWGL